MARVDLGVRQDVAASILARNTTVLRSGLLVGAFAIVLFGAVVHPEYADHHDPLGLRLGVAGVLLAVALASWMDRRVEAQLQRLMLACGLLVTGYSLYLVAHNPLEALYSLHLLVLTTGFGASMRRRKYLLPYAATAVWFTTAVTTSVAGMSPGLGVTLVASIGMLALLYGWSVGTEAALVEEVQGRDELLTAVFHGGSDGLLVLDRYGGEIRHVNDRLLELLGYDSEDELASTIEEAGIFAVGARQLNEVRWEVQHGLDVRRAWPCRRRDGSTFWADVAFQEIEVPGELLLLARISDATEQRRVTEELRVAKEAAEDATLAKSRFLASMSHEIRTPMNGVIGLSELLARTELSPSQREYVRSIQSSGSALVEIINQILDLSRVEAGRMVIQRRITAPRAVVRDVLGLFRGTVAGTEVELREVVHHDVPLAVEVDDSRLRQVLTNLVGNAVKFTTSGSVTLAVEWEAGEGGGDGEDAVLRVAVTDTGIGIAPEALQRLFTPFQQADASIERRFGGSGLGLSISRALVEAMGGTMQVESAVGVGTTFSFELPVGQVPDHELLAAPGEAGEAEAALVAEDLGSVLLVEDNAVNVLVARRMLDELGVRAEVAENGLRALEMWTEGGHDVLLMDMEMPELDGLQATERLRTLPGGDRPWVVALTANALDADKARCLQAGMNDFLAKPLHLASLRATLARVPRAVRSTAEDTPRERS